VPQGADEKYPRHGLSDDGSSSARFVAELPITGASVSVIVGDRQQSTISVSDETAAKIDELQFVLGEGPHWDVLHGGQPVHAPDLRGANRDDWPMLYRALAEFEVGALFAFPLRTGAATIGVVDLYRTDPGPLDTREVAEAIDLARELAPRAFQFAITLANDETGMILVQLDTDATEAFARLRAHAFASGISIQEVARDVVHRRLNFRDLPE
jgi:hypothetical protein